jgi:apolipoprotein N-acyltransferase
VSGSGEGRLSWGAWSGLIVLHALLFTLSFPPFWLWPLAFVAVVPFARLVARGSRRQWLLGGFVAGMAGGGSAVHWLTLFGVVPWLGTALGFGLYGLLFAALARPMSRAGAPPMLWLPLAWVACESLRGRLFFWAFPWFYLGHAVHPVGPLTQIADLGGQLLVSLVVAIFNGLALEVWDAAATAPAGGRGLALRRVLVRRGWLPALLLIAGCVYGVVRVAALEQTDGPRVLAVQPHVPQSLKNASVYDPEQRLRDLTRLTRAAARNDPPDVVVWPETMLPIYQSPDPALPYVALDRVPQLQRWLGDLLAWARAKRLVVGSRHAELRDGEVYEHNSAFFVDAAGRVLDRYDKMYLAPVSEHTPLQEAWPAFYSYIRENFTPGFSQFEAGREAELWELGGFRMAPSVCFDIAFTRASLRAVRAGADAIVNVSNYAWFTDSAELDLARIHGAFRAIELRRGVVASVNGGISHFVDPDGTVVDVAAPDGRTKQVEATLVRPLRTSRVRTLYVTLGDWPGYGAVAAAALGALFSLGLLRRRARGGADAG